MKLHVHFTDENKNLCVSMDENGENIDTDMGEVQVIHGKDGVSPIVGLEETEAGVEITVTDAEGEKKAVVQNGEKGNPGKTAYQYAQDGGYTGTEEEFAAKLAQEIPVVDKTFSVAGAAAESLAVKNQLDSTKNVLVTLLSKKQPAGDYALRSEIPTIDDTLTVSGAAADAKATGDKCTSLLNLIRSTVLNVAKTYATKVELAAPVVAYNGTLAVNTVYTVELSGEVVFTLPTPDDVTRENRIRMLANVATDTVIDWGTTTYYGAAVPFVNEGHYEFMWEYNPLLGTWVAGATRIGQVVAG